MEVLPPPVSIDGTLALSRLITTSGLMPDTQANPALVNAPVSGVSHEDPFPSDTEEETSIRLVRQDTRVASKRRLS